jgi:hypothetical protein
MAGRRGHSALAVGLVLAMGALACGDDDPTGPSFETIAGTYAATTLTVTEDGETLDLLEDNDNVVAVTLTSSGTTTGEIFLEGLEDDGGDVDLDLTGTYTLDGSTVRFTHGADTFLRDIDFTVTGDRLTGTWVDTHDNSDASDDTTVNVVLTRQ